MEKNNAILIDFNPPNKWKFFEGLNKNNDWTIEKCVANGSQKNAFRNIVRILKYFLFPLKIILFKKKYKKIVAWQQFYGLFMCFFLQLFHLKYNPEIVILTFIFKEKKGIIGKVYKKFIKKSLGYKNLKKIVVLSSYEIEYYSTLFGIKKNNFCFFHIACDEKAKFKISKGDYFVSAGRSNRDYSFLINVFSKLQNEKLIIISDKYKNENATKNVTILNDCFGDNYENLLAKSFAIIVSLDDKPISSGQLVINDAIKYKKPVIATFNLGIVDYISNNENGILINKNFNDMNEAINKLKNKSFYYKLSNCNKKYSEFEYGRNVLNLLI